MLSIGEDNLRFYPSFALFSTLRGVRLDHYFFHVSKSSEDLKKKGLHWKWKSFCLRNQVKTKKKRLSPKIKELMSSKYEIKWRPMKKSTDHPVLRCGSYWNYWGDAGANHSQSIGGMQSNYWGDISPHPSQVFAPLLMPLLWLNR